MLHGCSNAKNDSVAAAAKQGEITLHAINIVNDSGKVVMTLSTANQSPVLRLLDVNGKPELTISLNQSGFSSIKLENPNVADPRAVLEIDDKGAHVKFDRAGGASSYLFLNNGGESGTVFLDAKGERRLETLVTPAGKTEIRRYDRRSKKMD